MDHSFTPCPEATKGAESGNSATGNHFATVNAYLVRSLEFMAQQNDVVNPDEHFLSEDDCFVLAEDYVRMEEEYVMWNEDYSPRHHKKPLNGTGYFFEEGELFFPLEESNPYLEGSFPA